MARFMTDGGQADARPFKTVDASSRPRVHLAVMRHVREALLRGPHCVLELRQALSPIEAGALPSVLSDMVLAGEVASLGHTVYAQVPWMPATRPVIASPIEDLVLGGLTQKDDPDELAVWLGLTSDEVKAALTSLERVGLIEQRTGRWRKGRYRLVSNQLASNIRRGANNRVFTDIDRHE